MPDRLEDDNNPLSSSAGRLAFARSSTRLLFLDQRNSGSSPSRLCPEACSGNSIFASVDLRRTASRVRVSGGDDHQPDRSGWVCLAQRYPLSAKWLCELSIF